MLPFEANVSTAIEDCTPIDTSQARLLTVKKLSGDATSGTVYYCNTEDGTYRPLRTPTRLGRELITVTIDDDGEVLDEYCFAAGGIKILADDDGVVEVGGKT
jgi:hypothetical protein